jgi:hypothetical protein
MNASVTVVRAWYVAGAICFALIAAALTRARVDLLRFGPLLQVLLPTVLVAFLASIVLISSTRLASLSAWVLAGVLVPMGAVVAYFSPMFLFNPMGNAELFLMLVAAGSMIVVPVGVVGHLLLRFLIARRFHSIGGLQ